MKNIFLILFLFLTACAPEDKKTYSYAGLEISGSEFKITQAPIYENVVETSIVDNIYLPSIDMLSGNVSIDNKDGTFKTIDTKTYFAYVMKQDNIYYNFYKDSGGIFVKSSPDLINWSSPEMYFAEFNDYHFWNPAVVVDDSGVWHILVECAKNADQSDVGLCDRTGQVIPGAGNPWMGYVSGKGLMVIYGKLGKVWSIGAAIIKNGAWVESNSFKIAAPGVHICDPHLAEINGGTVMLLSYDQHSVYELKTSETLSQIYERVKND
jgi:hypothetical protein